MLRSILPCCQLQKDMAVLSDCIISDYGMRIKVGLNTNRSTERTYCRGDGGRFTKLFQNIPLPWNICFFKKRLELWIFECSVLNVGLTRQVWNSFNGCFHPGHSEMSGQIGCVCGVDDHHSEPEHRYRHSPGPWPRMFGALSDIRLPRWPNRIT